MVMRARSAEEPEAAEALAELCRSYWKPVYAFLRHQGNSQHDSEDLTQGFFAMLLNRGSLTKVCEEHGRLRSFLLTAVKRFAASEHERACALKRGGRALHLTLDSGEAEQAFQVEPATQVTPELLFERQWALSLLNSVLATLQSEYARDGRGHVFEALRDRLSAEGDPDALARVAERLRMTEGAVKVAVFRLRQRYRRLLQEEIAKTVDSADEVNAEIAHLFKVFSRS
jgi:DNA-directed RNA polymerase specialized sigma24 family protein